MDKRVDRYSRILIPLPPVLRIKCEVGKLVEETFNIIPEYVETDCFEGFAISWRSWYGFDNLRYPSMRNFFPLRLKRIIDDWLGEDEEMQVVEWIDEDRWEWLDVVKDYAEIFHETYPHRIHVYPESLSVGIRGDKWRELRFTDFDGLEELKKLYPTFRVLARRGYWNFEGLLVAIRRNEFYKKIEFDFEHPF